MTVNWMVTYAVAPVFQLSASYLGSIPALSDQALVGSFIVSVTLNKELGYHLSADLCMYIMRSIEGKP